MKWKIDWKVKMVISILCGAIFVIGLLFGITYKYFVEKLTANNERIVHMTFQESEEDLKRTMANAEKQINRFSEQDIAWKFSMNDFSSKIEKTITIKHIIQYFDEKINSDEDIYGFGILSGDGRTAVSTAERKSRTGDTKISEKMLDLMKKSKEEYPYVCWYSGKELGNLGNSPLHMLMNRPVLVGIKTLGEGEEIEEDSYLFVVLKENAVEQSYEQAVYNGSDAVLIDENRKIISATKKELLEDIYIPNEKNQNIEYDLSYNGWKLINMIPKNNYLREAKDIRNFGIVVAVLASFIVLFLSIIWTRRYTRPIQNLMEQMEQVGKEQLEIAKPDKFGLPELDRLNDEFYVTVQKLKKYIQKLQDVEQEKAKEELRTLQYQINPHFLYNSLNSIRWLAMMTNNSKVADSLVVLSKIIMPVLRNPGFVWTLKDELAFLENYIEMMRIRYGSSIEYHLFCDKELYEEDFPRFVLQPVIENCFVHGGNMRERNHIYLKIMKEELFFIEIQNTGTSMEIQKIKEINKFLQKGECEGNSIGLFNVRKRLVLLYGEKSRVWLDSKDNSVLVYLTF